MTGTLVVLISLSQSGAAPGPSPLLRKLSCIDRMDYQNRPAAERIAVRWRLTDDGDRRLQQFALYPDGEVLLATHISDFGSIECRAKLTSARLRSFKAEVERTRIWRLKAPRHVSARELEGLSLNLESIPQCYFELTPAEWKKSPLTPAIQAAFERLLLDVCGGECPEPKERKRPSSESAPLRIPVAPPRDPAPPKKP